MPATPPKRTSPPLQQLASTPLSPCAVIGGTSHPAPTPRALAPRTAGHIGTRCGSGFTAPRANRNTGSESRRWSRSGFRQFLRRGLEAVQAEWGLVCTAHHLLTLAKAGLPAQAA